MRTKQSAEFEKQESTWIYLLHQQAPPQTCLSAEASLSLPPIIDTAPGPNDRQSAAKQPIDTITPRLSDLGTTKSASPHHNSNKRACFPKKCDFPMCKNSSRSRGFCYSHGGGRRCRMDGCNNGAVSRDLCKRHGGGRRCRIAGCKSSSESGGLCYSHGGGRRCSLSHFVIDDPNVVETLLSLAKDQGNVKLEQTEETATSSSSSSGKSAYAIASLLN
ncbi:hypothetical protein GQ600_10985 [Phytophthora cactorum]|nr:hypothetical protein GQ600_10985 [Phytophthora cactorum]